MKKRIVTTLFSFICAASLALSFTACDSGNNEDDYLEPGVEVTEEQWNLAFERAFKGENYTCEFKEITEKDNDRTQIVWTIYFDDKSELDWFMTGKSQAHKGEKWHTQRTWLQDDDGYYSINKDLYVSQDFSLSFMPYFQSEGGYYQDPDNLSYENSKPYWSYFSSYEFVDGEYCATLYVRHPIKEYSRIDIRVRIDENGYLRYWSREHTDEFWNRTEKFSGKFYNYGTTKIEVPKKILDAVEEFKSKNN